MAKAAIVSDLRNSDVSRGGRPPTPRCEALRASRRRVVPVRGGAVRLAGLGADPMAKTAIGSPLRSGGYLLGGDPSRQEPRRDSLA